MPKTPRCMIKLHPAPRLSIYPDEDGHAVAILEIIQSRWEPRSVWGYVVTSVRSGWEHQEGPYEIDNPMLVWELVEQLFKMYIEVQKLRGVVIVR